MGVGVENLDAVLGHQGKVLDADAGAAGEVDARLDGERHAWLDNLFVDQRDVARLTAQAVELEELAAATARAAHEAERDAERLEGDAAAAATELAASLGADVDPIAARRALDALDGFPEAGFDLDEIASAPNLEIHFVDSSGILHWDFLGNAADFDFVDWNFSDSTRADYASLVELIHGEGYDIYIADHEHLGMYACRILVPGMSEIYPIDDLEFENNSLGNEIREPVLNLPELDDEACEALLDTLNDSGIDDQRPVAAVIGLAPDAGSIWEDLRVGELKTLLALAIADEEGTLEGCEWVRHFAQINPERRRVYRCIESLINLSESNDFETYRSALEGLFGPSTLDRARALLTGEERFFGITSPGLNLNGCPLHQRLLEAYAKVRRQHASR